MNIQSWMIKSWATLEWYLPLRPERLSGFKHVGTQVRDDGSSSGFRAGDTVWTARFEQWQAGLAWEWVEVKAGIVMLADPNSIVSNLHFVDGENQPVLGLAKTVAINRLVHGLPWQLPVCALLTSQVLNPVATTALASQQHPHQGRLHSNWRLPLLPAAVHVLPAAGRHMKAMEPPRRMRSRASDIDEGALGATRQDLRRAA